MNCLWSLSGVLNLDCYCFKKRQMEGFYEFNEINRRIRLKKNSVLAKYPVILVISMYIKQFIHIRSHLTGAISLRRSSTLLMPFNVYHCDIFIEERIIKWFLNIKNGLEILIAKNIKDFFL